MGELEHDLLARGLVTQADLTRARDIQARTGGRLAPTLIRLGLATEEALAELLAGSSAAYLRQSELIANPDMISVLNPRFLRRRTVMPIASEDGGQCVAIADPTDEDAMAAIEFALDAEVRTRVATYSDITEALAKFGGSRTEDLAGFEEGLGVADDVERMLEGESEAPVIRMVQRLLVGAADRRASDVHIEPMARMVLVRYRIDGRLVEVEQLPDAFASPIASRIKVMAGLDIAETRLPQDGRLRLTVRGREVDVRVSTSPTNWGEGIVLRLLGRSEVPLDLDSLGLPADAHAALIRALERPHGIILLTGPTGSGKTTTLYAALNRLRCPEVKILTVEDPVEVLLEGVNQVQVRPEINLSYAATLRAFLRQDPDILMIGEIRDQETAEIALRAALTGHLVLSTLHTNSALGAFTRLADIGIEPYLTASTVVATIAQRLIRALCELCRRAREPSAAERALFVTTAVDAPMLVHDAVGCPRCSSTGYRGRVPLIEVIEVEEPLREHIRLGTAEEVGVAGPPQGLLRHGLQLVAEGRTSIAEVQRAVQLQ